MLFRSKRNRTQDEYFDDDEEDEGYAKEEGKLAYIPAPGSPSYKEPEDDDEEDPLDAFMEGIEKQVKRQTNLPKVVGGPPKAQAKGVREDIEAEDDEETYYR